MSTTSMTSTRVGTTVTQVPDYFPPTIKDNLLSEWDAHIRTHPVIGGANAEQRTAPAGIPPQRKIHQLYSLSSVEAAAAAVPVVPVRSTVDPLGVASPLYGDGVDHDWYMNSLSNTLPEDINAILSHPPGYAEYRNMTAGETSPVVEKDSVNTIGTTTYSAFRSYKSGLIKSDFTGSIKPAYNFSRKWIDDRHSLKASGAKPIDIFFSSYSKPSGSPK